MKRGGMNCLLLDTDADTGTVTGGRAHQLGDERVKPAATMPTEDVYAYRRNLPRYEKGSV